MAQERFHCSRSGDVHHLHVDSQHLFPPAWLYNMTWWCLFAQLLQAIKVSTGDRVTIANFVPPSSSFNIIVLTGEIRFASAAKARPGSSTELNALELSSHLQSRYDRQVGAHPRRSPVAS